jgi:protein NrfD
MNNVKGFGETSFVIDLQTQKHWDWHVATYLYGFGASAGLVFLAVLLRGTGVVDQPTSLLGIWIALGAGLAALVFLFGHLGPRSRWRVVYVLQRPRTSWTARGATIVTILVFLEAVVLLPTLPGLSGLPWSEGTTGGSFLRGGILVFAVAFMAYSGLVLSSWNSIAFWNTPALPILFVSNSFLCGMAALLVIVLAVDAGAGLAARALYSSLYPYLLALLLANAFMLLVYLWGMSTATLPARESVRRLLRGQHRLSFWIGTVGLGLAFPLGGIAVAIGTQLGADVAGRMLLLAVCLAIHVGGLMLRDNVLRVGIYGYPV